MAHRLRRARRRIVARLTPPDVAATIEPDVQPARLTVAYDGASFHGFAENGRRAHRAWACCARRWRKWCASPSSWSAPGAPTPACTAGARCVSCDLPDDIDLEALARRLNRMCGPEVAVRSAAWAESPDFSARFDAHVAALPLRRLERGRRRTRSWLRRRGTSPSRCRCRRCSWLRSADRRARLLLVLPPAEGRPPAKPEPSMVRKVMLARWSQVPTDFGDGLLRFEIRANAFCHQMVRSIVGTHGRRRRRTRACRRRPRHPAGEGSPGGRAGRAAARSVPVGSRV